MITILDGTTELGKARPVDDSVKSFFVPGTDFRNVGWQFLKTAACFGEHPAFVASSREYDYSSLASAAINVSCYLSDHPGFRPGSRVVLLTDNSPEYLAGFYGTLLAGGVVVPLPASMEPARLTHVRAACDATIVLTNPQTAARRNDLSAESVEQRVNLAAELSMSPDCFAKELPRENELALLLYTSGSTGRPKGVMIGHRNVLANAKSILDYLPIRLQDRTLALLPFCHAYGNSVLQTHMLSGATLIVDGSSTFPNTIVDALQRHRINSFAGVPELYNSLLSCSDLGQRPLPNLRYMTVAGGSLRSEVALEIAERIAPARFFTMYGQTEATARLTFLSADELRQHAGSIGKAIPGVELQVRDNSGRELAPGEIGELCARGANVMRGYWNDQLATSRVLTGDWLRTGDIAFADHDGFLYLKGRRTNEIKLRGFRVDLDAVATALLPRFPGCRLVVVPFQLNLTTRLGLFLMDSNAPQTSPRRAGQICRETLPRHEVPNHIEIIDRFPLTAAFKVDLPALSQRAAQRCASSHVTESGLCGAASSNHAEAQG